MQPKMLVVTWNVNKIYYIPTQRCNSW